MRTRSLVEDIGGEAALRALVERFYDIVETEPAAGHLLSLHLRGHGMAHARQEQFDFLCGFLGGRRYYEEQHGHINVREVHAHVPIRREDAEEWLSCLDQAMRERGIVGDAADRMRLALGRVAMVLINCELHQDIGA